MHTKQTYAIPTEVDPIKIPDHGRRNALKLSACKFPEWQSRGIYVSQIFIVMESL